jgi:nucleoside-diphosphate kinase
VPLLADFRSTYKTNLQSQVPIFAEAHNISPTSKGLSSMQRTLILLKPDCVQRRLIGSIIGRFESKGLRLVGMKFLQASKDLAERHYAVHKGKPFYESLLQFLTAGPTVAMVWEGREAVSVARALMGPTDGAKAPPATIRGDFAISVQNNLVHGSDSPENAAFEIGLWFRPEELISYQPVDAPWVTGG